MSKISNVKVYGIEESIKASGYPMLANVNEFNDAFSRINENDLKRAKKLSNTKIGEGHDNFLNGIIVQFDLTFSLKAWTELQRYHFIDFISSTSSIHRITRMNIKDCCNKYVTQKAIENLQELIDKYNDTQDKEDLMAVYYNIPTGLELTARMTTNYRQLKTIYKQRRNHRLKNDWGVFCDFIETLPYSELITGGKE